MEPRFRIRNVLASIVLFSLAAGCTQHGGEADSVATSSASTVVPSLAALGNGSPAYELEIVLGGAAPRRSLLVPSPVGEHQLVEVTIETVAQDQQRSSVSAVLEVIVESSFANGSNDALRITAVELSASDPLMSEALQSAVGASLLAKRGPNHVVEEYLYGDKVGGSGEDEAVNELVAFWITQLLAAPVNFAGPLPVGKFGEGAIWDVTFQDSDGTQTVDRHTLGRMDAERYLIEAHSRESDRDLTILLEGVVGQPTPERQEIELGETTITVSSTHAS